MTIDKHLSIIDTKSFRLAVILYVFEDVSRLTVQRLADRIERGEPYRTDLAGLDVGEVGIAYTNLFRQLGEIDLPVQHHPVQSQYEGHGITPDVKVDRDPYATVTAYLYGKNYIFDYANKFYSEHKSIASADHFQIDEATYQDFMKFVKDKKFSYTTESEKAIEKLKKTAKEEGYLDKIKPQIELLEKNLAAEKDKDLINNRKDIEELLRSEIVGRYYYQKGRIVTSLNDDPDLKRAFEILLNTNGKDEYHSILSDK